MGDTRALKKPAKSLVNGVLRAHQRREGDALEVAKSARHALPQWLLDSLASNTRSGMNRLRQPPETAPDALRVNRQQTARDEYAAMLAESGISAESEQTREDGLVLTTPVDVGALPYFAAGGERRTSPPTGLTVASAG